MSLLAGDCYMCAAIPKRDGQEEECAAAVLHLCSQMHTLPRPPPTPPVPSPLTSRDLGVSCRSHQMEFRTYSL